MPAQFSYELALFFEAHSNLELQENLRHGGSSNNEGYRFSFGESSDSAFALNFIPTAFVVQDGNSV